MLTGKYKYCHLGLLPTHYTNLAKVRLGTITIADHNGEENSIQCIM